MPLALNNNRGSVYRKYRFQRGSVLLKLRDSVVVTTNRNRVMDELKRIY